MSKILEFDKRPAQSLERGVDALANAVRSPSAQRVATS